MREEPASSGLAGLIARHELLLTLALSPLLLFPGRLSWVALIAIGLLWLARRVAYGRLTRPSAMIGPQLLLTVMAVAGYRVSVDPALSAPKLWGILLQAALFFAALNGLRGRRGVQWLAAGLVALTVAVALLSLVGAQWDTVRLAPLPALYDRLPRLLRDVPDSGLSPDQAFFHPREVGATMGLLLPFVTAVALFGPSRRWRWAAAPALLLGGVVLLLSQAVMGLFGLLAGWAVLAVWRRRRLLVPILLLAIAFAVVAVNASPPGWAAALLSLDNPIGAGVVLRLDIWSRAIAMIADMPYTGIGLNTYPLIQAHFYTGYLLGPEPHAHNLLMQTALDLGLPGLLALIWLLAAFYATAFRAGPQLADRQLQALVAGAAAGVTAYVAGGALDVMTLGAKPVAALSLFFGLVGALHWLSQPAPAIGKPVARRSRLSGPAIPAALLLVPVLSLALRPAAVAGNLALIPAHRAIYVARELGRLPAGPSGRAAAWLPAAIRRAPDNVELHGAYGSLLAWRGEPAAALDALARRAALDARRPYAYAPFLPRQRELAGEPPESDWQTLQRVYGQWRGRFPERAENHVLLALVHERGLGNEDRAAAILESALRDGAQPRSLLEHYRTTLVEE
jgi:putative inorganic carbon (HCO3(-)) transporter